MSYMNEVFMNRQIAQAADALEIVEACKGHKLKEADAGKFRLLADEMKRAATRFSDLASKQSVFSTDEFFRRALAYANKLKVERAILVKAQREKREREKAEREALQKELAQIAA